MKCPKCGGAPDDMVLTSMPPQRRCSSCGFTGTEVAWMTGLLRGDEGAEQAHAERLQAAESDVRVAVASLDAHMGAGYSYAISRLIGAEIALALLERGGG